MTVRRKPCMFPFFYHGIAHYDCTKVDSISKKPWCGYDYKGNITLWSFCNMKKGRCKGNKNKPLNGLAPFPLPQKKCPTNMLS